MKNRERVRGQKKLIRYKTSSSLPPSENKIGTRGHGSFRLEAQAFKHSSKSF